MTDHTQTKLGIQNSHRSLVKIRKLTPEQLGIPSGDQEDVDEDNRSETLRETALEAAKKAKIGAAVRTDNGDVSTGSRLSSGVSRDIHALELAVWKGYDETRSPVAEAAIAVENTENVPCSRCLGVLSDYSVDRDISLWIIDGNDVEKYLLSDLLPF